MVPCVSQSAHVTREAVVLPTWTVEQCFRLVLHGPESHLLETIDPDTWGLSA